MSIIDIEQNAGNLKITKDIYLRILAKAIAQTEGDLTRCETALTANDFAAVQDIAHRLKGDYANMRIMQLSEIAKQMNEIAKTDQDKIELGNLLEQFKSSFDQIRQFIQEPKQ